MLHMRRISTATAIAAALVLPASAVADGTNSFVSPDAADGGRGLGDQPTVVDKRSPDSRLGRPADTPVDRRTPDSQLGRPVDTPVTPQVRVIGGPADTFDWADAGIGAAGGLAILAIAGGLGMAATSRRRGTRRMAPTS
jgi:hypothetical protein